MAVRAVVDEQTIRLRLKKKKRGRRGSASEMVTEEQREGVAESLVAACWALSVAFCVLLSRAIVKLQMEKVGYLVGYT